MTIFVGDSVKIFYNYQDLTIVDILIFLVVVKLFFYHCYADSPNSGLCKVYKVLVWGKRSVHDHLCYI